MDYNSFNIAALKKPGVDFFSQTIGSYDYWAIEYGYKVCAQRDRSCVPKTKSRFLATDCEAAPESRVCSGSPTKRRSPASTPP